jgi:phage pi2 protein 07
MNRSPILPELVAELKELEDARDNFIGSVLNDDLPDKQIREYKGVVSRCEKKIKGLRFKIRKMNEFILHQEHQLNQKGTK